MPASKDWIIATPKTPWATLRMVALNIWSQNLSGCPSVTYSEVKNMFFGYIDMMWVSY